MKCEKQPQMKTWWRNNLSKSQWICGIFPPPKKKNCSEEWKQRMMLPDVACKWVKTTFVSCLFPSAWHSFSGVSPGSLSQLIGCLFVSLLFLLLLPRDDEAAWDVWVVWGGFHFLCTFTFWTPIFPHSYLVYSSNEKTFNPPLKCFSSRLRFVWLFIKNKSFRSWQKTPLSPPTGLTVLSIISTLTFWILSVFKPKH